MFSFHPVWREVAGLSSACEFGWLEKLDARSRDMSEVQKRLTLWSKRKRLERDRSCEDDDPRVHHVFSYHLTLQILSVVFFSHHNK